MGHRFGDSGPGLTHVPTARHTGVEGFVDPIVLSLMTTPPRVDTVVQYYAKCFGITNPY